jgi:tetratricopeptide (TPR) repeat protein
MTEVDQSHPWLGLASFSEETRGFFHGRDQEVGELARRVQRKLLTVLFGQSGLGKTSILRAGIVPRLRSQGYCPVYVRIDYGPAAPTPAEQVRQALAQAARWEGEPPEAGESLWELLHRRDESLVDADGTPVIPLLIFDQFEEIFTLAQSDDGGRARAAQFVDDLAELVENRPPRALEERLEIDDSVVERLDFGRADYRVLIALREDYLAHLEGLKGSMPSITQNRMRLAPMTGQQALAAVRGPGAALISDEVAGAIVRFVAGGAEVAHAQVEPSLLSLICRELNDARIAAGRSEISLDLLAGSHASILADFYERALADQPPAVRAVVEDLLLTASGYRENVAEERVQKALAAAGAAPGTLAELVNRRLLRIEERLDVRRVELTHDVLCAVVRASRDLRQEREAREASELALARQQERERATRRALVRTRQVAAGCALLALGAVSASVYAYVASAQANEAERNAQAARAASVKSRGQAEVLVGYLNDDFARDLDGLASNEVIAGLNKRILEYYNALPNVEPGSDTERNRAVAMIRYAFAARILGRLDEAEQLLKKALQVLERRRAGGDGSEATAAAIGLGLLGERRLLWARGDLDGARNAALAASKVLAPWALRDKLSPNVLRVYGEVMGSLINVQADPNQSFASYEAARAAYERLGGTTLSDFGAATGYVRTTGEALLVMPGRPDLLAAGNAAYELGTQLLKLRPGDTAALRARSYVAGGLAKAAVQGMQPVSALQRFKDSVDDNYSLLRLDPGDTNTRSILANAEGMISQLLERAGQPERALAAQQRAVSISTVPGLSNVELASTQVDVLGRLALLHADLGDRVTAAASLLKAKKALAVQPKATTADHIRSAINASELAWYGAAIAILNGDPDSAIAPVKAAKAMLGSIGEGGALAKQSRAILAEYLDSMLAEALFAQNKPEQALTVLSETASAPRTFGKSPDSIALREDRDLLLATMQVSLGRAAEARQTLIQLLPQQRAFVAANPDDCRGRLHLAVLLALQSRMEPETTSAASREAAALVKSLPEPMKRLRSVRTWLDRIAAFTGKRATA